MHSTHDTAAILDYWRAVEIFSPQNIPSVAPNEQSDPVFAASSLQPLPWEPAHTIFHRRPSKNESKRFMVYCGVLATSVVRTILEDKLGKDDESFDERNDGETCLFAFSVTDAGRPLFHTSVLSSCAWGASRTLDPTPASNQWLEGFEEKSKQIISDFEHSYAAADDDAEGQRLLGMGFRIGRPLSYKDLMATTERVATQLGLLDLLPDRDIRIRCGRVATSKQYSAEDSDFLNSFYLKDLARVAAAARAGSTGKGLKDLLTHEPELAARIDVRKSMGTLFEQLSPALFPRGRWPSKGHHPLVFSQQFAINAMMQDLDASNHSSGGVFAVNGPPGTGKTTLLRDLIASVVVERAMRLSELSRPEDAFKGEGRWKVDKYNRVVSIWKEQFRGFEIVIASANNGAVENVTREIPGIDAIDTAWLDGVDYFPEFGSRLLDAPAWAMVGARLGNKANRNEFTSRLWYGSKEARALHATDPSIAGLLNWLKSVEGQPFDWAKATAEFKAVIAEEQALRRVRVQAHEAYARLAALHHEIPAADQALEENAAKLRVATSRTPLLEAERTRAAQRVEDQQAKRESHYKFRPGIIEIVMTLGRAFKEWRSKDKSMEAAVDVARQALDTNIQELTKHSDEIDHIERDEQRLRATGDDLRRERAAANEHLRLAKNQLGVAFPMVAQWREAEDARELSSPWADAAWNEARAKVFLAALALHKAFVFANPSTMRKSLQASMDVLSGGVPSDAAPEAVQAAWTTLFFLVPVVSTTFASFDRLFSHLGRESLGWLLVDEAGQAAPQLAAGAIWRAKRSVVVGDPLQLEPVVTIPFTAQQALRRHFQVSETWLPGRTSVQQLADRISRYGTTLKTDDEPLWVGAPLRVHRRCDQPMFAISNAIAYGGLMVFGTTPRTTIDLPESQWMHVEGGNADGHWIEHEGHAVEDLIGRLLESGVAPREIFLISPFRAVVRRLRQIAQQAVGIQVGTIHTAQGKESDVVILVLGGNPSKPGAKQWASQRPNLLNVAASRAKRRLYVVGNRDEWRKYPYFGEAAGLLKTGA